MVRRRRFSLTRSMNAPGSFCARFCRARLQNNTLGFLDVFGGMADWQSDWQSSKGEAPSSRKIPSSKAQVRRIKNAKFKMSKLPDAASILAFLIFNLLILNWLKGSFWGSGFGAF